MNKNDMNKKIKYGTISTALTVFVIVIAVLLNICVTTLDSIFDLSSDFSILQATKIDEISKQYIDEFNKLDMHVQIIVNGNEEQFKKASYDSSSKDDGSTSTTFSAKRYTYELIQSFMQNSDKIETFWIDVRYNPQFFKERNISVKDSTFITVYCVETQRYYLIDQAVFDESEYVGLERRIDGGIKNVTSDGQRIIGILTGHDEKQSPYLPTIAELNGYLVKYIDITTIDEIDDNISFLVLSNPMVTYSSADIKKLDSYLNPAVKGQSNEGDRSLIVFCDTDMNQNTLLEDYLSTIWGIKIGSNIVYDPSNSGSVLTADEPYLRVNYTKSGPSTEIAGDLADSKNYLMLTLGKTRDLELTFDQNSSGIQTTTLLKTMSDKSFGKSIGSKVNSSDFKDISKSDDDANGPFIVGAMSYHQGSYDNGSQYGLTSSNVLVFGSTSFLDTYYLSNLDGSTSATAEYIASMLGYLSGNENAVKIVAKSLVTGTLSFDTDTISVIISTVVIAAIPLICAVIAIIRWRKRKFL